MLTPEQLALRQNGICGSDIAAIVGLSRFANPIDVYRSKVDPVEAQRLADMESPLIRGILFEEPVIKWYSLITGRTVRKSTTKQHPTHKRIFATPDGIAEKDGDARVLEVKNTTWHTREHWGQPGTADIDPMYYPQVQFEMAVTGLDKVDVCIYAGVEPSIYHVDYDADAYDGLRTVAERFYTDHVIPRKPPAIDGSDGWAKYIADNFPNVTAQKCVEPDAETDALMHQLIAVRQARNLIDADEKLLTNKIKEKIGDGLGFEADFARITWNRVKDSKRIDYKRLIDESGLPAETIEKYTYIQPGYRRFLVTDRTGQ